MKKIGLIGGMSWESTELYYRKINCEIKNLLGGHHSAVIALESVDFQVIKDMQDKGDWQGAAEILSLCAKRLERSGADFILICTNTMHKVAPAIASAVSIPLIHLADATAEKIKTSGYRNVGFLGTKFSMEDSFYTGHLKDKHQLDILVPNERDREIVHDVIYNELCLGKVSEQSRLEFLRIIQSLYDAGAECIIEGCTEIVLLVNQSHTNIPLFDTTTIHAQKAALLAIQ
ncbi:aspartate/glutamate racemase family protein [Thalassotalea sp. M1531]|uniref:Aspartate/glutamate racemase family protein n=1 Tax=Thalassotalea algicola TaxID=2716224 RepID=A0A7Y0LD83_9GAMM|nr:aspartate/glutamate racemase family protein [Thalassotalea algicola]NMP31992.1 aspartate/glutamate racemase family protein [Thalassotalea algicola]